VNRKSFIYCTFLIILLVPNVRPVDSKNLGEDEQLILVGTGAYQDGFYDIAEKQLSRFTREFPRHGKIIDVYYLLGKTLYVKERFSESKTAFQKVISEGKNLEYVDHAYLGLAEAEIKLGDLEGARKTLLALVQKFPRFESIDQVYHRLGLIELGANRMASAKQFLQRVSTVSKKGGHLRSSFFWLGILSYRQHDYEAAIGYFRMLWQDPQPATDPHDHSKHALFWLGESYLKLGRYQDAKPIYQMFSERFKTDPLLPEVSWRLGYCDYRTGNMKEATEQFQSFKSQFKDSKWMTYAHYVLGEIHLSHGNHLGSMNEFNALLDRSPGHDLSGGSLLGLYWNRIHLNDRDGANRISQRLLKSTHFEDERNLNQWMTAQMTFSEGRVLDSLPFYFNIINTKFRENALVQIGKGYFFENKFREAATNFDIFLLEFPNSIHTNECLFLKGESLFRLGELNSALTAFDSIIQKKTTPRWQLLAMVQVADIHLLQNEEKAAEQIFREIIDFFPNHPMSFYAAFRLGNLHFKKKNIGEAVHFYSLVLKGNTLDLLGEVYFRMGEIFYQQEKYEKALKNFETAVSYLKETSLWFFLTQLEIGNLQRRWGRLEEAKKSYRIILDRSEDEDIRETARELLTRLESK
jgi:TolA-binding protein